MIQYTEGYKYQLYRDYRLTLPDAFAAATINEPFYSLVSGQLTIKAGYAWNGASGPTWDDKSNMRGSLVHDCLYQAVIEGHLVRSLRPGIDQLLYDLCVEDGMGRFRASTWLWAVRRHGLVPSIRNKDIRVAP